MDKITCLICNKLIPTGDLVYGRNGEYYCEKCFESNPPKIKRSRNEPTKIEKIKPSDVKSWNEDNKASQARIIAKYDRQNHSGATEL